MLHLVLDPTEDVFPPYEDEEYEGIRGALVAHHNGDHPMTMEERSSGLHGKEPRLNLEGQRTSPYTFPHKI